MRSASASSLLGAGEERVEVPAILPVLPVRDLVVFPGVTVPLSVGRAKSLAALERAGTGGFLIVATQRDAGVEDPGVDDLHPIGCVARVMRVIDARRESKQAIVVGVARTRLGPAARREPGPADAPRSGARQRGRTRPRATRSGSASSSSRIA